MLKIPFYSYFKFILVLKLASGSKERENFLIQEMKADQKYSKVVGIKAGGGRGAISMKLKEQLRRGGVTSMKSMNFRYN